MGNIGEPQREVIFEPIPEDVPQPEQTPTEPQPVPA